ncbi:MAG: TonB family protein [Luteibaculaceae bacterium]
MLIKLLQLYMLFTGIYLIQLAAVNANQHATVRLLTISMTLLLPVLICFGLPIENPIMPSILIPEFTLLTSNNLSSDSVLPGNSKGLHYPLVVWSVGSTVMLIIKGYSAFKLKVWLEKIRIKTVEPNLTIIKGHQLAFTLFNRIYVSEDALCPEIIAHEQAHTKRYHYIDKLLMEMLIIVFWFVLPVYFLAKQWNLILELEADTLAVKDRDVKVYQRTLLEKSLQTIRAKPFTFQFNQNHLKLRIMKLSMQPSRKSQFLGSLFITSLTVGVLLVSCSQSDTYKDQGAANNPETSETIYTVVEEPPVFNGGNEALFGYLSENIKYPPQAKADSVAGVVFITFVVDKTGTVTQAEVLKGIGGGCDEEALRVVKEMPKWTPGKQEGKPVSVQFNLPIRFSLK